MDFVLSTTKNILKRNSCVTIAKTSAVKSRFTKGFYTSPNNAYPVQGLLRMRRIHFISSLSQVYIIFTLYWRIDADKVTSCRERHLETIHAKV